MHGERGELLACELGVTPRFLVVLIWVGDLHAGLRAACAHTCQTEEEEAEKAGRRILELELSDLSLFLWPSSRSGEW
jgi:hypothetical protein